MPSRTESGCAIASASCSDSCFVALLYATHVPKCGAVMKQWTLLPPWPHLMDSSTGACPQSSKLFSTLPARLYGVMWPFNGCTPRQRKHVLPSLLLVVRGRPHFSLVGLDRSQSGSTKRGDDEFAVGGT
ncbi:unnamed protein product [Protopolystoma xenopodis]|uniref:Uncharacterized protein n=1 Tax=Protopolystoma xenopodis TaxID=117903 RepID=A0A3S5AKW9_9PLAT|nr:unnamed protein product [Protopolystoma xenopodis]